MESTADDRFVNNTMRHEYRVLNDEEKRAILHCKNLGHTFLAALVCYETADNVRELVLAGTKMEEAVMWAVKGITK